MQKILKEIDRIVIRLAKQEKEAKTKTLKAQYSASQTTLVLLKMWIEKQHTTSIDIAKFMANNVNKTKYGHLHSCGDTYIRYEDVLELIKAFSYE